MKNQLKCNVVMLPTEKASNSHLYITLGGKLAYSTDSQVLQSKDWKQHLYFTSDREIKVGDWIYDGHSPIFQAYQDEPALASINRKIEATTDPSISRNSDVEMSIKDALNTLPQIPESFIQAYVKANGNIKEVMIEAGYYCENCGQAGCDNLACRGCKDIWETRTRADNTVIIHQSKLYTRDEVIRLMKLSIERGQGYEELPMAEYGNDDKWIAENL